MVRNESMVFTSYLKSTVYRCYQELCRCLVAEGQKCAFAQAKLIWVTNRKILFDPWEMKIFEKFELTKDWLQKFSRGNRPHESRFFDQTFFRAPPGIKWKKVGLLSNSKNLLIIIVSFEQIFIWLVHGTQWYQEFFVRSIFSSRSEDFEILMIKISLIELRPRQYSNNIVYFYH